MKIIYQAIPEILNDNYIGEYTAYKIAAISPNGQVLTSISNAFVNGARATEFISICNKYSLSPMHLYDVLYDTLSS